MDGKRKQALQEFNKLKNSKQKRTEQLAEEMDELDSDEEKLLQESSTKSVQRGFVVYDFCHQVNISSYRSEEEKSGRTSQIFQIVATIFNEKVK